MPRPNPEKGCPGEEKQRILNQERSNRLNNTRFFIPPIDIAQPTIYTGFMPARVFSCAVLGLEGVLVEVEVDFTSGFGHIFVVGLPDTAVKESRERVRAAIKNIPLNFPRRSIVINLAPANVQKEGPAYDLPMAVGILTAFGDHRPGNPG